MPKRKNATPPVSERLAWVAPFLAALRDSGNVRASCEAAKISYQTVYKHKAASADFRERWDVAMDEAIDVLEFVARKRGIAISDTLLIFLLKAHRPQKYSDRLRLEVTTEEVRAEARRVAHEMGISEEEVVAEAERVLAGGK